MQLISTGVKGLDELLGGGLPKGKCVLVVGSPGAGKTILQMQFLTGGAKADERGLYVAMDETPEQVKTNLSSFGWDIEGLEKNGKILFLDATMLRQGGIRRNNVLVSSKFEDSSEPKITVRFLVETITKIVKEEDIQRIAVDPVTSIMIRYDAPVKKRRALFPFFDS